MVTPCSEYLVGRAPWGRVRPILPKRFDALTGWLRRASCGAFFQVGLQPAGLVLFALAAPNRQGFSFPIWFCGTDRLAADFNQSFRIAARRCVNMI